jgi:hypothetical protein
MKPKPSVVMSMVVRMAASNHSASSTYSAWKPHTSAMPTDTPPDAVSCLCAMARLMTTQPIRPERGGAIGVGKAGINGTKCSQLHSLLRGGGGGGGPPPPPPCGYTMQRPSPTSTSA